MRIPFGEWLPDQPAVGHMQLRVARNIIARDNASYAPFAGFTPTFTAFPGRCTGVAAVRQPDEIIALFAGTDTALFHTTTGPDWDDVSRLAGYGSLGGHWRFANLNFRVFATNFVDEIQTWLIGTSTEFADLAVAAPKARYMNTWFPGFLVVGNTDDAVDGARPNRVWWPAFGDPTDWPVPGSADAQAKQSDFRDLHKGGAITGITGPVGGAAGAVFCREAIYRVDYEGPPTIFRIVDVETDRGTDAPNSIVSVGNAVFYLGNNGFYRFDGAGSVPIGTQKVDKTFWRTADGGFPDRVYGVSDPINKIVMWAYPENGMAGTPSRIIAFNWDTGRWTEAMMNLDILSQFYTPSYTIDNIDSFGDLETITPDFDSRAWLGGSQSLVGVDASHRLGFFNGANLEATIETGDYAAENGRKTYIGRVRPYVDGGTVTIRSGTRDEQDEDDQNIVYSDYVASENDGTHLIRTRGRYSRIGMKIAAGGEWDHANGVDVMGRDGGRR